MNRSSVRNDALRDLLIECGATYAQLAGDVRQIAAESGDRLRTGKSAVANWVAGQDPEPRTAGYIAEALSRRLGRHLTPADCGFAREQEGAPSSVLGLELGPDPVDTLRRIGDADIQRRKFLTASAYSVAAAALPLGFTGALTGSPEVRPVGGNGKRVGRTELNAVRDMVNLFTAIDERHGGQHGRTAVVQYLRTDVADLCRSRFTAQADQREAFMLAGCVAYLCGWKAYDNSEHGLAQRYYLQSLAVTREADDPLHEAWILRIMAHSGMDIRRPQHTLHLAEAALDRVRGRVAPVTEALFAVTRARALATARRGPEAVAQIRQAHDMVMTGSEEELPYWAALWGTPRGTVGSHSAKTFRALGDHANAERHYAASVRARPQHEHQRITALTLAAQGREQAAQGHLEAACGTWDRALDLFGGVRSARAAIEIKNIRRQLAVFHRRGIRAAAQLDERARAWQLTHS